MKHPRTHLITISILALLAIAFCLPSGRMAVVAAQEMGTLLPTPGIAERPDTCERNNRREEACNLPLDTVSGPFTFLPAGDQDWYRVDLGQPNGLETLLAVRADDGLDLLISLSRDDGTPLTSFATPAISTTLSADIGQPILIRVENRATQPVGRAYTIELRKMLPPPPGPVAQSDDLQPDALENNWNPENASPIAVETIYDLTFACPEARPGACPGGDHDYLRFPIKAGTAYLIATFDLGPGVDTVLDLYLDSNLDRPLLSNDDARSSGGLLSALHWIAPSNGFAYLRVGPRVGGTIPELGEETTGAGTYRLVVALGRGELASKVQARIAEQTNAPTPTRTTGTSWGGNNGSTSSGTPTPIVTATATVSSTTTTDPASAKVVQGDAVKGKAMTLAETTVRLRPQTNGEVIQVLPSDTVVTLIGKHYNLWVRVQTDEAVLSGWVLATDLRQFDADAGDAEPSTGHAQTGMPAASPTSTIPGTADTGATSVPTSQATRAFRITALPPLVVNDQVAPVARTTRVVTVSLRMSNVPPPSKTPAPGQKITPLPSTPIIGLRIQLINAFGDVLAEAVAPGSGTVVLAREVTPETALFIRLPAVGFVAPATGPQVVITLPEVTWQP